MADLTTLENIEAWLSLKPGNADEAQLSRLITAASAFVEKYCSRRFLSASYTETRNGNGGRVMGLPHRPLTAIASLKIYSTVVPAGDPVDTPGYFITDNMVGLNGFRFTAGLANVAISYTAGYETVPADVEQAVIDLVALRYRERGHIGLVTEGMAQQTTTYLVKDLTPAAQTMLNLYKRVGLVA